MAKDRKGNSVRARIVLVARMGARVEDIPDSDGTPGLNQVECLFGAVDDAPNQAKYPTQCYDCWRPPYPRNYRAWPELMFLFHMFDHPLYNQHDELRKPMLLDINGNVTDWRRTN
jgi:hypothetical protein